MRPSSSLSRWLECWPIFLLTGCRSFGRRGSRSMPCKCSSSFMKLFLNAYVCRQFLSKAGSSSTKPWDDYAFPIHQFLVYVRDTWVGRQSVPASPDGPQVVPDIAPMFPPEQWSAWRSVSNPSIPSTTGGNEAYNIQLRR
jgi:hypothetical protein